MKSNKQRRLEIKNKRREKAIALRKKTRDKSVIDNMPNNGAVKANPELLLHNNTYGILPSFYLDLPYTCRDCGSEEVWTAKQQKWWYEIRKAHIDSTAIRCLPCRLRIRKIKGEQKQRMKEMAEQKPHPNEAFFRKR